MFRTLINLKADPLPWEGLSSGRCMQFIIDKEGIESFKVKKNVSEGWPIAGEKLVARTYLRDFS